MELTGSRQINAPRSEVWEALNDPDVLKACIPGCTEMTRDENGGFTAVVTQKVGPVKATFKGAVTLSDIVVQESYTISGEGKGGAAGFAKGGAAVRLEDFETGTKLSYVVEAKIGGKLAQLGSRVVGGVAKKLADKFFENFSNAVAPAEPTIEENIIEEPEKGILAKTKGWFKKKN